MNEQELVILAQRGNTEAFNELVLDHQDRMYTQAYYILDDAPMVEPIFRTLRIEQIAFWDLRTDQCNHSLLGRA